MSDDLNQPVSIDEAREDLLQALNFYCMNPVDDELGQLWAIQSRLSYHVHLLENLQS